MYTDNSCGAIAKVVPSGASPVGGTVSSCVTIDGSVQNYNGSSYVQRHFDIEPATNASTATATVTFYVLQSEFDAYNSNNGSLPDLPTGSGDATGIANLRITQFHGTGTAPGNYTGSAELINPADANIVWNATNNWWEITIDVTGFSGFYIHTSVGGPLPVNILTFSGQRNGNVNALKWVTATENNNKGFHVERSTDGRSFTSLGFVASRAIGGNSNNQITYAFNDNSFSGDRHYYRLRQVDLDGREKTSNIVLIKGVRPSSFTISGLFPNPTISKLNVLVDAPSKQNATLQVIDVTGKVVKEQRVIIEVGTNTVEIDVNEVAAGTYLLKLTSKDSGETSLSKFVKQ
jgi:hypothetical protein